MALDNKAKETLAVNAVKNSIVTSEYLDQFIAENDKEPSWDGFVYIYGDKSKKKSNLKGRMPVQVKGTEAEDHSQSKISFSMSTVDLKNYLNDGGCILFVVYIGNNGLTHKIYYAELTPIKLRQLLSEANKQGTKAVTLKEFPYDNNKKATIFLNCLQNCQKQASFIEGRLHTLEELEKQGLLENLVIPISGVGIKDPQMALIKNEVYIYANIKGSSIPQPLNMIPKDVCTQQTIDETIKIGNKQFYSKYRVIKSANEVTWCFGSSFTMRFYDKGKTCKINYRNSDKIRVMSKDLDFMLEYLASGYFMINNIRVPFDYSGMDSSNFNIEEEKKHLNFAKKVVKVLDKLGCSEDIDIKDMNDEDWINLNRLILAILDKKPIKGLRDDLPSVICLKVGKLKFAIYLKKCEENGTYEMYDFFKTYILVVSKDEINNEKILPISQFSILHEKDLLTMNNIDFDVLLPSFQELEHHYETYNRANRFLLELLNACDKSEGLRKKKY